MTGTLYDLLRQCREVVIKGKLATASLSDVFGRRSDDTGRLDRAGTPTAESSVIEVQSYSPSLDCFGRQSFLDHFLSILGFFAVGYCVMTMNGTYDLWTLTSLPHHCMGGPLAA